MKFEQILKIYWSKGFFFSGKTQSFDLTFKEFMENKKGLNKKFINFFIKRFELNFLIKKKKNRSFIKFSLDFRKIINIYLSRFLNINYNIFELFKYNIIRLYLIKSFRGRCQALNKPSRGQRTWSNASTSKKLNLILKNFIKNVKKFNKLDKKDNILKKSHFLKKKIKIKKPKIKMIFTKTKKNIWF